MDTTAVSPIKGTTLREEDVVSVGKGGKLFYTYDNLTLDRKGWAERLGISAERFRKRTKELPVEKWFEPRNWDYKTLSHKGVTRTIPEWSAITGLPESTIFFRMRKTTDTSVILGMKGISHRTKARIDALQAGKVVSVIAQPKLSDEELFLHNQVTSLMNAGFSQAQALMEIEKRLVA